MSLFKFSSALSFVSEEFASRLQILRDAQNDKANGFQMKFKQTLNE